MSFMRWLAKCHTYLDAREMANDKWMCTGYCGGYTSEVEALIVEDTKRYARRLWRERCREKDYGL